MCSIIFEVLQILGWSVFDSKFPIVFRLLLILTEIRADAAC